MVVPRLAAVFMLLLLVAAVFAPAFTPFDPNRQALTDVLVTPFGRDSAGHTHLFGTDFLGRDLWSRLLFGSRVSLAMAASVVGLASVIGGSAGLIAGYAGGAIDNVLMRAADVQLALPFMLLAIAVMAALGPGLDKMILVLVAVTWATYARLARGSVLAVKERDFVIAAHSLGASAGRILLKHILPNIVSGLIIVATLEAAQMVVAEAALSYLGLGVRPPTSSWGSMLADGRNYLYTSWWLSTLPGAAIFLTVLSINIIGTELRERTDPKLRRWKLAPAVPLAAVPDPGQTGMPAKPHRETT